MAKKLIILGLAVLLICIGLSAYIVTYKSDEQRFIGTWTGEIGNVSDPVKVEYTYFSDKTCTAIAYYKYDYLYVNSTWKIHNDRLVFLSSEGEITTNNYEFLDNDNRLILTNVENNNTLELTRK